MRLLICAGMTGGGVYPALAVLQSMRIKSSSVLWIGSEAKMEQEILSDQTLNIASIPAAGLHGVGFLDIPGNLIKLTRGYFKAQKLIREFQPDVIFFTGGFLGVPVSLAAGKIPSVVFIPDIEPGTAIKYLVKRAGVITMATEETIRFLPSHKQRIVTGYPLRSEVTRWTRGEGLKALMLSKNKPVLLVFGGSKGALSINQALYPILPELLKVTQVVHLTGTDNWTEAEKVKSGLPLELSRHYHAYPFLHEKMGAALASSDLVVCRAGASTLGELPFFGLPAVLVPYPHAWKYQHTNAEFLEKKGGAIILENKDLNNQLLPRVTTLLKDAKSLGRMQKCMRQLNRPGAAKEIGKILFRVGTMKGEPAL